MAGKGEVRFRLVAEVEQVKNALNEVKNQVGRLGEDLAGRLGPAGSILSSLGPAGMAAAAGVGAIIGAGAAAAATMQSLASQAMAYADAIEDTAARTGISSEALQELKFAAELTGSSMETAAAAIGKMQRALVNTPDAFKSLGLSVRELRDMAPEEQFAKIASAISSLSDPAARAAKEVEIFGKSGAELNQLILKFDELKARAHEVGAVMGGETTAALGDTQDAVDGASKAWEAFKNELGAIIVVALDLKSTFNDLATSLGELTKGVRDFAKTDLGGNLANVAKSVMTGGMSSAVGTTSDLRFQNYLSHRGAGNYQSPYKAGFLEGDPTSPEILFAGMEGEVKIAEDALKGLQKEQREAARAAAEHQRELDKLKGTIRHTYDELVNMGPMEEWFDLPANNKLRSQSLTSAMGGLVPFRVDGGIEIDLEREGQKAGAAVRSGFGSALDNLGSTIIGAIQGGGDIGRSVGAALGEGIGKDLGESLAKAIGGSLGKALGSIAGPLGALGGSLLGGLFDKLFTKEEMKVNDLRDAFFEAHGGWAALQKQLASLTNQDLVKKIFDAKTVEQFNAAVREAEGLLGLQSEAQQKLQEAIDRYGFSIEELGPKYQQQKLDEMAGSLLQDFQLLTASGIEQTTVLAKMGPAFQEYVGTALRAGAALPEAMRPIIEQLIQSGQLLDENGNAFTSLEDSGITFTQTLSEGLQSLIEKIDELVRALTGAGSAASRISIPSGGSVGSGKGVEDTMPRSFAGGSGGFQNFGSGTPAVLHGVEAVIRPGDLRSIGGPNVTYAPVITVYGAGNADEIRDVVMTSLRDNADGMRDYVASVAR